MTVMYEYEVYTIDNKYIGTIEARTDKSAFNKAYKQFPEYERENMKLCRVSKITYKTGKLSDYF